MRTSLKVFLVLSLMLATSSALAGPPEVKSLLKQYSQLKDVGARVKQVEKIFSEMDKMMDDGAIPAEVKVELLSEAIFLTYRTDIFNSSLSDKTVGFYEKNTALFAKYFEKKTKALKNKELEKQEFKIKILKDRMQEYRADAG